jgi:hypothetical protein
MRNGIFLKQKTSKASSYIVEDLIAPNRLILWASPPGEGKSLLGEAFLYSVAYGAPVIGKKVTPGNLMFIDSENRLDVLQSRCQKIIAGLKADGYTKQGDIDFQHYSGFLLDDKGTWVAVEQEIKALKPVVIMLDHLAMFHHQDENKAGQMTKVATAIEEMMNIANSSVLVLHHFNKKEGRFIDRLRGSTAIYAKSDVACEVRSLSVLNGCLEIAGLIPQPRKDITPPAMRIRIEEGTDWLKLKYDGTYKPIDDPRMDELCHKFYHDFLETPNPDITVEHMIEKLEKYATETEVRGALRFLEHGKGLINSERKGLGGGYHYTLNNPTGAKTLTCPWCNQQYVV